MIHLRKTKPLYNFCKCNIMYIVNSVKKAVCSRNFVTIGKWIKNKNENHDNSKMYQNLMIPRKIVMKLIFCYRLYDQLHSTHTRTNKGYGCDNCRIKRFKSHIQKSFGCNLLHPLIRSLCSWIQLETLRLARRS